MHKANHKRNRYIKTLLLSGASSAAMIPMFAQAQTDALSSAIEEVVVSATRRAQAVQDIPYNVSAISGEDLENMGIVDGGSLLRQIPGVFVSDIGGRTNINSNISIRGINANNPGENNTLQNLTDASVSTYVGDTAIFLNMNLTDIERVEILRGPQGTLYGSGSVGGTVRYIFNKPDPEEFSASISGTMSTTDDSDDNSFGGDIVLNLPLSDTFALRLVGGGEEIAGWIDARSLFATDSSGAAIPSGDFLTSGPAFAPTKNDVNETESWYFRASVFGELSDNATALITYMHQEDEFSSDPGRRVVDLETSVGPSNFNDQDNLSSGEVTTELLSLEVSADLGFASLTSSTAYTENETDQNLYVSDLYQFLDEVAGLYFGFPRILGSSTIPTEQQVFTQEFRLVSQSENSLEWMVGAFYKKHDSDAVFKDTLPGFNDWLLGSGLGDFTPVEDRFIDIPFQFEREVEFEDVAIFGELTYHISDSWQITGGIRAFWQDFTQSAVLHFPYCSFFCAADGENLSGRSDFSAKADFQDQIVKVNTSYDLTDDHMVYLTFSQGFRHGGANAFPTAGPFAVSPDLQTIDPDELDNYELGFKGYFADKRVSYTAAYFLSNWENIQLDTFLGLLASPGVVNGKGATSQGLELDVQFRVSDQFDVNFSYSYTDAELTDDADLTQDGDDDVFDGDPIPGVSEHAFSLFADYVLPLSSGNELQFHIDASWRSDFETTFNGNHDNYAELDGFELVNAAINWKMEDMRISLFANNLTNEEGVTATNTGRMTLVPSSGIAFTTRPRTIGVTITKEF